MNALKDDTFYTRSNSKKTWYQHSYHADSKPCFSVFCSLNFFINSILRRKTQW